MSASREITTDSARSGEKGDHGDNASSRVDGKGRAKKTGAFSPEECQQIKDAVYEYCAARSIDVGRLCSECEHKSDLKGAWIEIARSVPGRSAQSVYRKGLRLLHPFRRGQWSDSEVERLIDMVAVHGEKWARIQRLLNRTADSCRDKYREVDVLYAKGRWTKDETETLKRLIREHLKVGDHVGFGEFRTYAVEYLRSTS